MGTGDGERDLRPWSAAYLCRGTLSAYKSWPLVDVAIGKKCAKACKVRNLGYQTVFSCVYEYLATEETLRQQRSLEIALHVEVVFSVQMMDCCEGYNTVVL